MPIQILHPTTDTTNTTTGSSAWAKLGGGTPLYPSIADTGVEASGVTGIRVNVPATSPGSVFVSKLTTAVTPPIRTSHQYRFAFRIDPAGLGTTFDTDFKVELRCGYVSEGALGTLIHSDTYNVHNGTAVDAQTTYKTIKLTSTEANNISDYTQLYVRFVAINVTEADTVDVYFFYMFVPDSKGSISNVQQFPAGPVWYSEVQTFGSTNGEPVCQLRNDGGNKAVIRELAFIGGNGDGGSTTLCRLDTVSCRLTNLPYGPGAGGNTVTGNIIQLDDEDPIVVPGLVMKGYDFVNAQFLDGNVGASCAFADEHFFQIRPANSQQASPLPTWIRRPGSFPLCILPGQAFEICWRFNGSGFAVRLIAVWQEIPTFA